MRDIKGRFARHREFAHFSARRHLADTFRWLQEEFFQREVNTKVLASLGDGKQLTLELITGRLTEADRRIVPTKGLPLVLPQERE